MPLLVRLPKMTMPTLSPLAVLTVLVPVTGEAPFVSDVALPASLSADHAIVLNCAYGARTDPPRFSGNMTLVQADAVVDALRPKEAGGAYSILALARAFEPAQGAPAAHPHTALVLRASLALTHQSLVMALRPIPPTRAPPSIWKQRSSCRQSPARARTGTACFQQRACRRRVPHMAGGDDCPGNHGPAFVRRCPGHQQRPGQQPLCDLRAARDAHRRVGAAVLCVDGVCGPLHPRPDSADSGSRPQAPAGDTTRQHASRVRSARPPAANAGGRHPPSRATATRRCHGAPRSTGRRRAPRYTQWPPLAMIGDELRGYLARPQTR